MFSRFDKSARRGTSPSSTSPAPSISGIRSTSSGRPPSPVLSARPTTTLSFRGFGPDPPRW